MSCRIDISAQGAAHGVLVKNAERHNLETITEFVSADRVVVGHEYVGAGPKVHKGSGIPIVATRGGNASGGIRRRII